ncbi:polysaccharide biosynthesis C-terminal domain-containing protein [Enterococcus cecorum]|uniref:oligosaccharide flippase family protein n=2 Tax=Enterococcus cecorum TaxID=44008 RepID=UPI000A9B6F83|nr:polysaccharide biosynthesis C-terminal domain-containing protein [Enterococcus cecorum]CAI3506974.1 oligosaccharide flippase family protein [Enterococcus cecorum]
MRKLKLFLENFLIYGLGGVISKFIPLVMLPIVTRIMPNRAYFGISDLSNTLIQFSSALAIMGMFDAMYRLFFEKDDDEFKKDVCSTTLVFTITMSAFVFLLLIIFRKQVSYYFFSNTKYAYIVYISATATLVGATNSIISAPTRMQNKRRVFLIANTLSPIISYSISIPMLLEGYYTIALPLSSVISGVAMEIMFGVLNYKWFNPKRFNWSLLKKLLVIAVPLFPNFLIYWIFNSSDRVMITNIIGIGAAGLYSVGSKLGNCSQLIYTAFAGGWQYFAFSTMNEDNQVKNNSLIFEYLGIVSFVSTSFICAWSFSIFKFLFSEQYLSAYIIAPYLFLAPLLQMLFQIAANQFLVIKKTWPNMFILLIGALINILMNLILIPIFGIEGASLATLVGYTVSVIICVIVLCKMRLMVISKKFIVSSMLMVVFLLIWRCIFNVNVAVSTLLAMALTVIYLLLYISDIKALFRILKNEKKA